MRSEVISIATLGFSRLSGAFPFHPEGGGWISRRPVRNIPSPPGSPHVFTPTELELGGLPLPARVARFCFRFTQSLFLSPRTIILSSSLILFIHITSFPLSVNPKPFLLCAIRKMEMVERMDRMVLEPPKDANILCKISIVIFQYIVKQWILDYVRILENFSNGSEIFFKNIIFILQMLFNSIIYKNSGILKSRQYF